MAYCLINKSNYFHNLSKVEQKIDKDKITVNEFLKTQLFFSIQKDESCEMALNIMDQNKLFALLVLDGDKNLGSVIREDILDIYISTKK